MTTASSDQVRLLPEYDQYDQVAVATNILGNSKRIIVPHFSNHASSQRSDGNINQCQSPSRLY